MASSSKLTTQSLEERVYDAIRTSIVQGEVRPGDPLVESKLSEQFGISKTPVREALIRLKRDGLVEALPHRVTRVARPTPEDIRQVCELRTWIESALAARCAENPSEAFLERLRGSVDQAAAALADSDATSYGTAVRGFSDVIVEESANAYGAAALERLWNVLILIAHISRNTAGRRERSIEEHRAILRAIETRDPAGAAEATRRHLQSIEQDSLAALERLDTEQER